MFMKVHFGKYNMRIHYVLLNLKVKNYAPNSIPNYAPNSINTFWNPKFKNKRNSNITFFNKGMTLKMDVKKH